jgi:hypothetical protein
VNEPIYLWKGDYFCGGDIVGSLTEDEPWSAWVEGGGNANADASALAEIAEYFNIDAENPADIADNNFPLKLRKAPEPPSFCRVCMQWFTVPTTYTRD